MNIVKIKIKSEPESVYHCAPCSNIFKNVHYCFIIDFQSSENFRTFNENLLIRYKFYGKLGTSDGTLQLCTKHKEELIKLIAEKTGKEIVPIDKGEDTEGLIEIELEKLSEILLIL